jgi:hypothetical protein
MKTPKGIAQTYRIEGGKFTRPDLVKGLFLRAYRLYEGDRVEVRIVPQPRKRSLKQNAYYWGVVVPCVQECLAAIGTLCERETVHEFLKLKFLNRDTILDPETEKFIPVSGSTAKLSKDDFSDYIEKIREWTLEYLGAHIPDANEENEPYPLF